MEIISRKEAKEKGLQFYYTGNPCKRGHYSNRTVSGSSCVDCAKITSSKWRKENDEYVKDYDRKRQYQKDQKRYWGNREYEIQRVLDHRKKNREYYTEYNKQWVKNNPDKVSKYESKPSRKAYRSFCNSRRRVSKLQRQLTGFDDEIKEIYLKASLMRLSGKDVHVDHIVPLQGEFVSGLHVPWNLQIISAKENLSKSNKFEAEIEIFEEVFGDLDQTEE